MARSKWNLSQEWKIVQYMKINQCNTLKDKTLYNNCYNKGQKPHDHLNRCRKSIWQNLTSFTKPLKKLAIGGNFFNSIKDYYYYKKKKERNSRLTSYLMMKEWKVFPCDQEQGKMLALVTSFFIFVFDCCWVFVAAWAFLQLLRAGATL